MGLGEQGQTRTGEDRATFQVYAINQAVIEKLLEVRLLAKGDSGACALDPGWSRDTGMIAGDGGYASDSFQLGEQLAQLIKSGGMKC